MYISVFSNAYDKIPRQNTILKIASVIKDGKYKSRIEAIRAEKNDDKKKSLKAKLPAFTLSTFSKPHRRIENISSINGFTIDIDKVFNGSLQKICDALRSMGAIMVFVSPSGNGVKAVFRYGEDIKIDQHYVIYDNFCNYISKVIGKMPDVSCKDPIKLCFISSDENLYYDVDEPEFDHELYVSGVPDFNGAPVLSYSEQKTESSKIKNTTSDLDIIDIANNGVTENRNIALTRLCGSWLGTGCVESLNELQEYALTWNAELPAPMDKKRVLRTAKSIWDKDQRGKVLDEKSGDAVLPVVSEKQEKPAPTSVNEEWPDPIPLADEYEVEPFPDDVFHEPYQEYIKAVAHAIEVDVAVPACVFLSVLATCWQKRSKIKLLNTWSEPLNLYVCNILESGERKSAVLRRMCKPIYDKQKELYENSKNDVARAKASLKIKQTELSNLHVKLHKEKDFVEKQNIEDRIYQLQLDVDSHDDKTPHTWVYDDITNEKLAIALQKNNETAAIFSSEGGLFTTIAGLYNNQLSNYDIYLKGYDGDYISVSRVSRDDVILKNPLITMYLAVQKDVINKMANNEGLRARGFVARWLFSMCESMIGKRKIQDIEIDRSLESLYHQKIIEMLEPSIYGDEPTVIKLSNDAWEMWKSFGDKIEEEQKIDGDLHGFQDFGSKMSGKIGRIAGLLHIAKYDSCYHKYDVDLDTMTNAIRLGGYFINNLLITFNQIASQNEPIIIANEILETIKNNNITEFKARDIIRMNRVKIPTADLFESGVRILVERSWVKELSKTNQFLRGRPEAKKYGVSPKL